MRAAVDGPYTAALRIQFRDSSESNLARADQAFEWLEREIEGQAFICCGAYSMANIIALTTIDFGAFVDVPVPERCHRLRAWHAKVAMRPSASA